MVERLRYRIDSKLSRKTDYVKRYLLYTETYRGVKEEVNLLKKIRLDIAVNEDFVKPTIEAIMKGARTGNIGDGKIFVVPLEQCYRIRTGEKDSKAIG